MAKVYKIAANMAAARFRINPLAPELDIYSLARHLCKT